MSDPSANPTDEQATAEAIDEEVVDPTDFPPEEPLGVGHIGETPAEDAGGESLADRADAEEPEAWEQDLRTDRDAAMLVDPDEGGGPDEEAELIATEVPYEDQLSAEEAAIHIEEP
jgi:hypothetical protein